jgi:TonB family protein
VPKPPDVKTGLFADDATAVKPERPAQVAPSGFESAASDAARLRRELQPLDAFDTTASRATAPRAATIADPGFGSTTSSPTPQRPAPTTGAAGFSTAPTPRAAVTAPRGPATTGFGIDAPARPAAAAAPKPVAPSPAFAEAPPPPKPVAQAPPPPRADRPVEVVFKPTPAYTDEARAQRVEGEVVLEVEFTAAGEVRVLRVVRGLGHGLDDMARRAAEQIRFKPATSKGSPVDFRANLTIVFRLT